MIGSFKAWKEYYRDLYPQYGRISSVFYSWFNYRHFNRDGTYRKPKLNLLEIILSRNR